jgi:hypothetical protein
VSLLARSGKPNDLLPHLHQYAIDATGGACSLLFRLNPRNGLLHPTSAFGLDAIGAEPWTPGPNEAVLLEGAFDTGGPLLVVDADHVMPELAARLEAPAALVIPLARGADRMGLLAIGFHGAPSELSGDIQTVADAFIASLELFRLRQRDELQRDLVALLDDVSTGLSATLNLAAGLGIFCQGASRMFAADRTSVWIHDRRARHLLSSVVGLGSRSSKLRAARLRITFHQPAGRRQSGSPGKQV